MSGPVGSGSSSRTNFMVIEICLNSEVVVLLFSLLLFAVIFYNAN